jgi:hypothetical protein
MFGEENRLLFDDTNLGTHFSKRILNAAVQQNCADTAAHPADGKPSQGIHYAGSLAPANSSIEDQSA